MAERHIIGQFVADAKPPPFTTTFFMSGKALRMARASVAVRSSKTCGKSAPGT